MKINALLANANGNLSKLTPKIETAVLRAEKYVGKKLKINHGINITFAGMNKFIINGNNIGGRTHWYDFIIITIDTNQNTSEDILFEIICHELCHAARWKHNPEWATTLFDGLISEGIATHFEEKAAKENKITNKTVFLKTITNQSQKDIKKITKTLSKQLFNNRYNHDEIFYSGNPELPPWAGYIAGYNLVKEYLSITSKTIEEAFTDKYADFKIALNQNVTNTR